MIGIGTKLSGGSLKYIPAECVGTLALQIPNVSLLPAR